MREGFYLSPDGKNIIELKRSKEWHYGYDVIGMSKLKDGTTITDSITDVSSCDIKTLFSAWEYLPKGK